MDPVAEEVLQQTAKGFIGEWGWLALGGFIFLLFRTTLESLVSSMIFFMGSDFDTDDVIVLNGKPARIIRKGLWKSTFFVYQVREGKITGGWKYIVTNDKLKDMEILKPLPKIDLDEINGDRPGT